MTTTPLVPRLVALAALVAIPAGACFLRADEPAAKPVAPVSAPLDPAKPLTKIAFGSCIQQDRPQPIWRPLAATRPELLLLIGDNIYGDSPDMAVLAAKYATLMAQPDLAAIRKVTPLLTIWDDHDFGVNDGGDDFPMKDASQALFCDVFGVPADSPRRSRPGLYDAVTVGPEGKRTQVVLLDTRYFRSPLAKWKKGEDHVGGPYRPTEDTTTTLLGEAQWAWLAETLKQPADLRIVASSIQVVPTENNWEYWQNFPHERARLFELIKSTGAGGVVFLSGDRHLAEISRLPADQSPTGYPLYDITSSAINQRDGGTEDEPNRYRLGKNYREPNFGTIAVDWDAPEPTVTLAVHGEDGTVVREVRISLAELRPSTGR